MDTFELPSNIKQIGTIGEGTRVYLEDYACTYLTQYAEAGGYNERLAFLIGRRIVIDGLPVLFISGAVQGRYCDVKNGLAVFTAKSREAAEEIIGQYFAGLEIVGWMKSQPGYGAGINAACRAYHKEDFPGKEQVLFAMDPIEKASAFYSRAAESEELVEAKGYFIYYDKNRGMHEYMLDNRVAEPKIKLLADAPKGKPAEDDEDLESGAPKVSDPRFVSGTAKRAAAYRRDSHEQRRLLNLLVGLSAVLFVVCFIMGAGLVQNQDRISNMERQLVNLSTAYKNLVVSANKDSAAMEAFAPQDDEPHGDAAQLIIEDGNQNLAGIATTTAPPTQTAAQPTVETARPTETAAAQPPAQTQVITAAPTPTAVPSPTPEPTLAPTPEPASADTAPIVAPVYYTVELGDSLSSISLQFYGDKTMVKRLMEANGIEDADNILAGQKLVIPER